MKKLFFILLVILLASSCASRRDYKEFINDPTHLHRSVKAVTDIIVHDIFSPPVASRIYAYISVAAYEAARHQDPTLVTLAGQLHGLKPLPEPEKNQEYCFQLASAQALLKTARIFVFSEDMLDEYYNGVIEEFKKSSIPDDVFKRSIQYGDTIAARIIKWSATDNYKQTRSFPKYSIEEQPHTWKPTPPAYMDAVEPHWNKIRTFVIDSASQFRCAPPVPFSTDSTSRFYALANEVYKTGLGLTDEQKNIARFWDCNPFVLNVKGHVMFATKKISPGGHWMNITHVACVTAKSDFAHAAEAYARVALSLADGFIACWDEKYRSRVLRPETYINRYIDENWMPFLQTPPFPEYTSGHSVISAAAAAALTGVFGDNFSFTDSTEVEFGLQVRNFHSFNEAANEAAQSRLYGGIHYRPANEIGVTMGRQVGAFIVTRVRTRRS
jgi:hypothetical protein